MAKKKTTHKIRLLKIFLSGGTFISNDGFASNANQYPRDIKQQGIELIEWYEPTEGRHKRRKLNMTDENIERTKKYLNELLGIPNEAKNSKS